MTTKELTRRYTKLESAFNLLIGTLDKKSVTLLANSNLPKQLRTLLHEHMEGTISSLEIARMCKMLRVKECDLTLRPSLRLAVGLLLATVELRHSVAPTKVAAKRTRDRRSRTS